MKYTLLFLLSLQLLACAISEKPLSDSADIEIHLAPGSSTVVDVWNNESANTYLANIIDNDGNTYNTYWTSSELSNEAFLKTAGHCLDKLDDVRFFPGRINIANVSAAALEPVLYQPFVSCIYDYGFKLHHSEAFAPVFYQLGLQRIKTSTDQYLPVGAVLEVRRAKSRLRELFLDASECRQILLDPNRPESVEKKFKGAVFVDIKPFAQSMKRCLEQKSYQVTLLPEISARNIKQQDPERKYDETQDLKLAF